MTPDGRQVVVWDGAYGSLPSERSAQIQVFDANGGRVLYRDNAFLTQTNGGSMLLGTHTGEPSVAIKANGEFIVAFRDFNSTGGDILASRYAADGSPIALYQQANPTDATEMRKQESPVVAFGPDGSYVIAWSDEYGGNPDRDVVAQRFDADGTKIGSAIVVESVNSGSQRYPSIAIGAEGGINVAFTTDAYGVGVGLECVVRRFLPDAAVGLVGQGGETRVAIDALATNPQSISSTQRTIATDPDGNLFIVFQTEVTGDADVHAEIFHLPNQGPPLTEFRVNTTTTGDQTLPAVAGMADGRTVVVWRGFDASGTPTILGQRFDAAGRRFGSEFVVNSAAASTSFAPDPPGTRTLAPAAAFDANANFTVVWVAANGGNGTRISGRRFPWNPQSAAGSEFTVSTDLNGDHAQPSVAVAPDGRFAVTWIHYAGISQGDFLLRSDIRFFAANGTGIGGSVPVGSSAEQVEQIVVYSPAGSGSFVVAWRQTPTSNNLFVRSYTLSGATISGPTSVDDPSNGVEEALGLAIFPDGSGVMTWETVGGGDGNGTRAVYGQRLNADGTRRGGNFRVNTFPAGDQAGSSVAVAPGDEFLVCYRSDGFDGSGMGVALQRFDGSVIPVEKIGIEMIVNKFRLGEQTPTYNQRSIATDSVGNYFITWQSAGQDGSGTGIYATKVFVSTPPVVTTGEATDKTASTATLTGTVTPNDVTVDVVFEYGAAADALTNSVAAKLASDAPATGLSGATALAVHADVSANLAPNIDGSAKTYFCRVKATAAGGTTFLGEVVQFTIANTPPLAQDDVFIILGDDALDPIKQFSALGTPGRDSDADPGQALKIVAVNAPTAAQFGAPTFDPVQGQTISYDKGTFFDAETDGDSFSYTIEDPFGARATATIRVFSVRVVGGLYSGLIGVNGGGTASGRLDVMLTRLGTVTGSFKWQGQLYTFKGAPLGTNGSLLVSREKVDGDGAVLTITLTLNPATKTLAGKLTDNSTDPITVADAEITGVASLADVDLEDLPEPGTYSAYIDPGTVSGALPESAPAAGAPVQPRGLGFSQITVKGKPTSRSRPARNVGRMPDDQPFSSGQRALIRALRAASTGQVRYPFYVDNLYPRLRNDDGRLESGGVVSGDLGFTRTGSRFDSDLNWERRPNPDAPRFGGGIRGLTAVLNAIKYGRPPSGNLPIGIRSDLDPNAKIDLREGDLTGTITQAFKLRRSGAGAVRVQASGANPQAFKLSVNANGGKFSGSFVHTGSGEVVKFNGVFKSGDGQGVFTNPVENGNTGRVQVQKLEN